MYRALLSASQPLPLPSRTKKVFTLPAAGTIDSWQFTTDFAFPVILLSWRKLICPRSCLFYRSILYHSDRSMLGCKVWPLAPAGTAAGLSQLRESQNGRRLLLWLCECHFSLCLILLALIPQRCHSSKPSPLNFLHTNLHLRGWSQGNQPATGVQ